MGFKPSISKSRGNGEWAAVMRRFLKSIQSTCITSASMLYDEQKHEYKFVVKSKDGEVAEIMFCWVLGLI